MLVILHTHHDANSTCGSTAYGPYNTEQEAIAGLDRLVAKRNDPLWRRDEVDLCAGYDNDELREFGRDPKLAVEDYAEIVELFAL